MRNSKNPLAERAEGERIVYESLLRSEAETTLVADDDVGVDDFGDTQARPTTVVTPIVQTTQLPPGADLPRECCKTTLRI